METKALFTTISAGKYKGKKLQLPSLSSTRSTKSIIKGSLFDTLQFDLIDQNFVEVFGGSGSMGLEALSRGAKHAYFIEKDKAAFSILKRNCKAIDESRTTALNGDSFTLLPTLFPKLTCKTYFYFDPPFSIREGMDDIYQKTLALIASIPPASVWMVVIEHMSDLDLPERIGVYSRLKTKKFGKSSLSYYVP
jgi:16S rRNA (guanine(966)-N(2))-methyltransferase RsmD